MWGSYTPHTTHFPDSDCVKYFKMVLIFYPITDFPHNFEIANLITDL